MPMLSSTPPARAGAGAASCSSSPSNDRRGSGGLGSRAGSASSLKHQKLRSSTSSTSSLGGPGTSAAGANDANAHHHHRRHVGATAGCPRCPSRLRGAALLLLGVLVLAGGAVLFAEESVLGRGDAGASDGGRAPPPPPPPQQGGGLPGAPALRVSSASTTALSSAARFFRDGGGGDPFAEVLATLKQNQTAALHSFQQQQQTALEDFVARQGSLRRITELELATAAESLVAERRASPTSHHNGGGDGSGDGDGEQPHDTWAFMIPVIQSNTRRQTRLARNLCALTWPPKALMGVGFLVDAKSRPLVEASLPLLHACGVPGRSIVLYDDPPPAFVQPEDALARHELFSQFSRRASIAVARNHLLQLVLQPRHTAVVWIDSDLMSFPADSLLLLQQTGADVAVPHCVMVQDPTVTYDLNSWQETPASRKRVAALPEGQPLFEGYDNEADIAANVYGAYRGDAQVGECRWQQTANCDPDAGPREWHNDLDCDVQVPSGASGYCHCQSVCKHEPFSCRSVCGEDGSSDDPDAHEVQEGVPTPVKVLPPVPAMLLGRKHMGDLVRKSKGVSYTVPLDGVGGTMIFARAEVFRHGVVFPTELVNHQVETEGLAQMALQRNFTVVGMPNLIIKHA